MSAGAAPGRLAELAAGGASGEFVCATAALEIHVYLQGGRVAWATDSEHPLAFVTHLQEAARIELEAFRRVLDECRRNRLPLGETLVGRGLATWEQVRAALAHQVTRAMTVLAAAADGQVAFFERAFSAYDDRLTFDLREVVAAAPVPEPVPAPAALSLIERPGLAVHLRRSVDGLQWVELLDGGRLREGDPAAGERRVPEDILATTLSDGAGFAAMRSPYGSLVGVALAEAGHSLWCRLAADSTFGAVVSAILAASTGADRTAVQTAPRRGPLIWSLGAEGAPANQEITGFLPRAPEVVAALVLDGDIAGEPLSGSGSGEAPADYCLGIARRRAPALRRWHLLDGERGTRDVFAGYAMMVSGEAGHWCFGAELDPAMGETLWVFLDRKCTQGLGWAYLTALARALLRREVAA